MVTRPLSVVRLTGRGSAAVMRDVPQAAAPTTAARYCKRSELSGGGTAFAGHTDYPTLSQSLPHAIEYLMQGYQPDGAED
jgi:hypothetical protein